MLYAIVALLVIIADQWVKYWVSMSVDMFSVGEPLIPGIMSLVNVHNDGCALSMLSGGGARIYFIILTGVFTVAVILALATNFISGKTARWSLVLVTAGGLSNCIDRVINGYVQDMFKLELFNFPIFNVADIFITVCCIVFVLAVIFGKEPEKYHDEFEEEDDEEEDRPKRKSKKLEKAAAEEKMPVAKAPKNRKKPSDDYEQYKAARAARPQTPPSAKGRSNVYDSKDPFAEWEKANAKVEAQRKNSYAAQATGVAPSYSSPKPRYSAPGAAPKAAQPPRRPAAPRAPQAPVRPAAPAADFPETVRTAAPSPRSAAPVQRPVAPPSPAPQAAAKLSGSGTDFDLDDILNEFK